MFPSILQIIFGLFVILSFYDLLYYKFTYRTIDYWNIKDRTIILNRKIEFQDRLLFTLDVNDKFKKYDEIYIYIDSPGGYILNAYEMIESFRKLKVKTICIAKNAKSAAFTLFQFCNRRLVTKESVLMTHEAYFEKVTLEELIEAYDKLEDNYDIYVKHNKLVARKLNITYSDYKAKIKKEWVMIGIDSIKNKAADEMVNFINFQ